MEHKNGSGPKPRTVCDRLSVAIRTTTPFRTTRFGPTQQHQDAAVVCATSPNVSLIAPPPLGDYCLRVSKQSVTPSDHNKGQQPVQVPVILESANHSNPALEKVGSVPSHGAKSMNRVFSEFIAHAGKKIRSPAIVCDQKAGMKYDSFNDKVSDYIEKTRYRFHMPSTLGVSKIALEEELEVEVKETQN